MTINVVFMTPIIIRSLCVNNIHTFLKLYIPLCVFMISEIYKNRSHNYILARFIIATCFDSKGSSSD
jgi:hypothetical protein